MSLEKLRIGNLRKESDVTQCGSWEEVNSTIIQLQLLQKLGNFNDAQDLLSDSLLNENFPGNNDLERAQCILKKTRNDIQIPKPIGFRPLTPSESALGPPITPEANVEHLNRTPVATMRVCGWESDRWFKSEDAERIEQGRKFIEFWNRLHPERLPCIELEKDQKLVAVLYSSLQGIRSLMIDENLTLEAANVENVESRVINFVLYRKEYEPAVDALIYLCPVFREFCRVLKENLESIWLITEFMEEKAEAQRVLRNAAFHLNALYEALKMCNVEASAWKCNLKVANMDRDAGLLRALKEATNEFENVNRSLSGEFEDRYGFLNRALKKSQHSFRGMSIAVLTTEEAETDSGAQD